MKESNSVKTLKRGETRFDFSPSIWFSLILPQSKKTDLITQIQHSGKILHLTTEGVLVETEQPLQEESFVRLKMALTNGEILDGILGKIKKVEKSEENQFFLGIELCPRGNLPDFYGDSFEIKSFEQMLKEVIWERMESQKIKERI
jgi:hypothetical protein